jgi:hypothetical protein
MLGARGAVLPISQKTYSGFLQRIADLADLAWANHARELCLLRSCFSIRVPVNCRFEVEDVELYDRGWILFHSRNLLRTSFRRHSWPIAHATLLGLPKLSDDRCS